MTVPFIDLSRRATALMPELLAATERVLRSGRVIYGAELDAFEAELAAWFGVAHAVGVASGTDAVEIALRAVGVGPGDRVECPAFTAVPCANAIEATGAELLLAEVSEDDGNQKWVSGVGEGRAGLAVSMFGTPAAIRGCAETTVEDLAHAMGAVHGVGARKVGTVGIAGAVSFYPTKCLGTFGDGGAIVTDNADIAARCRRIRHYGFEDGGVSSRGQNSRLSELQAAYLRLMLPRVDEWNRQRRAIAARYDVELAGRATPVSGHGCVYHVYVMRHPERDRIVSALQSRGIGVMVHYPKAIHEHPRWRHLGYVGQFPNAEMLARQVFSLPCYPELTAAEQDAVIAAVKEIT